MARRSPQTLLPSTHRGDHRPPRFRNESMVNSDALHPALRAFSFRFGLGTLLSLAALGVAHVCGLSLIGPAIAVAGALVVSAICAGLTVRALRRPEQRLLNAVALGALLRMAGLAMVALPTSWLSGNALAACAFFLGTILPLKASEMLLMHRASLMISPQAIPSDTPQTPPSVSTVAAQPSAPASPQPEHLS